MQASQKPVIWTVAIAAIAILLMQFYVLTQMPSAPAAPASAAEIATAIAPLIAVPTVEVPDTAKVDKLCELTNGCEFYKESDSKGNVVYNEIKKTGDFKDAFADIVGIDKDDFKIIDVDIKDKQVRAYSKSDEDKENFEVKAFVRVEYRDNDAGSSNYEVEYVVVTSTLDEGDYDSMTLEQVDRNFEFD